MKKKTVDEIIEEFKNQYTELCLFDKWIDNCYQSLSFNKAEIKKKKKYKSIEKNRMLEEIRKTDRDLNDFQIKRRCIPVFFSLRESKSKQDFGRPQPTGSLGKYPPAKPGALVCNPLKTV